MDFLLPEPMAELFNDRPDEQIMTRVAYGGRGSGKTQSFVQMIMLKSIIFASAGVSGTILCAREYMVSIPKSTLADLKKWLNNHPEFIPYFDIGERVLRTSSLLPGRIDFAFVGLDSNLESLKGFADVILCFIDEGETVKQEALNMLGPSLRYNGRMPDGTSFWSELWISFNPRREDSAVWQTYVKHADEEPSIKVVKINYDQNPWFKYNINLQTEREKARRTLDPAMYRWIWEGDFLKESDIQVLKGKVKIEKFEPDLARWHSYIGLDWGFSQDPSAAVLCFINPRQADVLYVRAETGGVGIPIDLHPELVIDAFESIIPEVNRHTIYADHLPSNIDYCSRHGLDGIQKAYKPKVVDGVQVLRQFSKIIIHPDCKELVNETDLYSFKTRPNGDITTDIVDAYNHYIDALRYALSPVMKDVIESGSQDNTVGFMKKVSSDDRNRMRRRRR